MGCGRSKLQSVHPSRKSSAKNKEGETQESSEEKSAAGENGETAEEAEARRQAAIAKGRLLGSGPLLAMADISTSQLDFFKMLDEKIANGADYDSSAEPSRNTSPRLSQITLSNYPIVRSPSPALAQNGHKHCAMKFTAQQHVPQSSPTRSKTPTPKSPNKAKERLPTLQASPPPHEPNSSNNNNISKKNSIKFGNPIKTPYSMKHRPPTQ